MGRGPFLFKNSHHIDGSCNFFATSFGFGLEMVAQDTAKNTAKINSCESENNFLKKYLVLKLTIYFVTNTKMPKSKSVD